MIIKESLSIEDLSFRDWECFAHLACQRKENSAPITLGQISVPIMFGQSGSIRSTEMVEAENLDLVLNVRLSGRLLEENRISFAIS